MLSNAAPSHARNGSSSSNRLPQEASFRHMSSGSLNIPSGVGTQSAAGNGQPQNMAPTAGGPPFAGPRSPPNKQSKSEHIMIASRSLVADLAVRADTNHVPCKFFRQGACQAGKACPFSHDLAATVDNVCKYFAKVGKVPCWVNFRFNNFSGQLQIRTKMCKHTCPAERTASKLQGRSYWNWTKSAKYWWKGQSRSISWP